MDTPWIATRQTAQGHIVHLWPDGALTWALGAYVKGSARPRTPKQIELALRAGWLVMGEISIYDDDEVPALIEAARWAAQRDGLPGTMRDRLHRSTVLRPTWTTLETDRDGAPRVQCWVLPRLRWPGLAVWRESGRYSVWSEAAHKSGSYKPTGCEFGTLRELTTYLESLAA